jgi:hypothetical protein
MGRPRKTPEEILRAKEFAKEKRHRPRKTPEEILRAKEVAKEKRHRKTPAYIARDKMKRRDRDRERRPRKNGMELAPSAAIAQVTPDVQFPIELVPSPNNRLLSKAAIDECATPLPELLEMIMKNGYKPQFPLEAHPDMTKTGLKTCHEFYKQEWFHCPLCCNRGPHVKKSVAAEHCSACKKSINTHGISVTSSSKDMDPFFSNGYPDHLPLNSRAYRPT